MMPKKARTITTAYGMRWYKQNSQGYKPKPYWLIKANESVNIEILAKSIRMKLGHLNAAVIILVNMVGTLNLNNIMNQGL